MSIKQLIVACVVCCGSVACGKDDESSDPPAAAPTGGAAAADNEEEPQAFDPALIASDPRLRDYLARQLDALCGIIGFGTKLAEMHSATGHAWQDADRVAWGKKCEALIRWDPTLGNGAPAIPASSPAFASTPLVNDPTTTAAPALVPTQPQSCAQAQVLLANIARVRLRTLPAAQWIAYGDAIAACGPETQPWIPTRVNDETEFRDTFVQPFINGDVFEQRYEQHDATAFKKICNAWKACDG